MESSRVDEGAGHQVKTPDLDTTPGGFPVSPVASISPPAGSAHNSLDSPLDPDSYYRSYDPAAVASSHSTLFADPYHPPTTDTTTTQSRVVRNNKIPSSLPKPASTTSGPYNFRANLRSSTSPASRLPSGGGSEKPRSVLTTDLTDKQRSSNLSVIDRARQFEQQTTPAPALGPAARLSRKSPPPHTPGGQEAPLAASAVGQHQIRDNKQATSRPSTFQRRTPSVSPTATHKMSTTSSAADAYDDESSHRTPSRQPLFGEVITVTNGGVGHGIPTNYAKRSASESNMQSPSTSPTSTRSRSRLDAQLQRANATSTGKAPAPHSRSTSAGHASPTSEQQQEEGASERSSKVQLPASTYGQSHRPPPARQVAKPRRYSASTEHLSSASGRDGLSDASARPTTPHSGSSSKRYVRTPDRPSASGHSVNAVIKALPDSSIPAPSLRSSRPRVPLSAASTASSRAKQSGRSSSKSSRNTSPVDTLITSPASRERKPRSAGMLRAAEEAREKSRSRNRRPNYAPTDSESSQELRQDEMSLKGSTYDDAAKAGLKIHTAQADLAANEADSPLTDMEVDESPILGRTVYQPVGQRHDRNDAAANPPQLSSSSMPLFSSKLSPIEASPDPNELVHANFDATPGAERSSTPYEPPLEVLDALASSGGDEGTIHVQLRGTPVMGATSWGATTHNSTAVPSEGGMRDSGIGGADVDQHKSQLVHHFHSPDMTTSEVVLPQFNWPAESSQDSCCPLFSWVKGKQHATLDYPQQDTPSPQGIRLVPPAAHYSGAPPRPPSGLDGVGRSAPPRRNLLLANPDGPRPYRRECRPHILTNAWRPTPSVPPEALLASPSRPHSEAILMELSSEKDDSFEALTPQTSIDVKDDTGNSFGPGRYAGDPPVPTPLGVVTDSFVRKEPGPRSKQFHGQQASQLPTVTKLPEPVDRPCPPAKSGARRRIVRGSTLVPLLLSSPRLTKVEDADKRSRRSSTTPTNPLHTAANSSSGYQPYDTPPEGDNFQPGSAKIIVGPEVPPKHSPLVSSPLHSNSHPRDNHRGGYRRRLSGGRQILPLRLGASQTKTTDTGDHKSPQLPDIPGVGTGLGLLEPTTPQLPNHPPPPVPAPSHRALGATHRGEFRHPPPNATDPEMDYIYKAGEIAYQAGATAYEVGGNAWNYMLGTAPAQPAPVTAHSDANNAIDEAHSDANNANDEAHSDANYANDEADSDANYANDEAEQDLQTTPAEPEPVAENLDLTPDTRRTSSDSASSDSTIRPAPATTASEVNNTAPQIHPMASVGTTGYVAGLRAPDLESLIGQYQSLAVHDRARQTQPTASAGTTGYVAGLRAPDLESLIGQYQYLAINDPAQFQQVINEVQAARDSRPPVPALEPPELTPEELEEIQVDLKRVNKVRHIIRELVKTEEAWRNDLELVTALYIATVEDFTEISEHDARAIFGPWDQLSDLSARFTKPLRKATRTMYRKNGPGDEACLPKDWETSPLLLKRAREHQLTIGALFLEWVGEFAQVFGRYIYNQTYSAQRLEAVKQHESVQKWLQVAGEMHKDISGAWDLPAFLVKPLQRFTKYPLLLKSLLDEYPPDHPDYRNLSDAHAKFTEEIGKINTRKARLELIEKVKNGEVFVPKKVPEKKGFVAALEKIPGFKFFKRDKKKEKKKKTDKELARDLRIKAKAEDPGYQKIVQHFGAHFFQIQIVLSDIIQYTNDVRACAGWFRELAVSLVALADSSRVNDNQELVAKWISMARTAQDFATHGIEHHATEIHRSIVAPLKELFNIHEGPYKLMSERKNHLAVYVKYLHFQEDMRDDSKLTMPEELEDGKGRFEALNETLKDELPRLYERTNDLVRVVGSRFMMDSANWHRLWVEKFAPLLELGPRVDVNNILPLLNLENMLMAFRNDFGPTYAAAQDLSICNGTLRQATTSHLPTGLDDRLAALARPYRPGFSPSSNQEQYAAPVVAGTAGTSAGRNRGNSYGPHLSPAGPSTRPSTAAASRPTSEEYRSQARRLFDSAMPLDTGILGAPEEEEDEGVDVMFIAASLFEFHIDPGRVEAGYPYLSYHPGEIFNVLGVRGETWLASNQDDGERRVGWIWDKHFAKISHAVPVA